MIKVNNKILGQIGEEIVANTLQEKGYTLLQRNFRCRFGEIDIIAKDGPNVVFIEVKTRKSKKFGEAEEAVDSRKQRKLRTLAELYLAKNSAESPTNCRFDVYSVYLNQDNQLETIRVFENCF